MAVLPRSISNHHCDDGQHLESWLLADDHQHGSFNMGLATIELKQGAAPAISPNESKSGATDLQEFIFKLFAKAPEEQVCRESGERRSTGATDSVYLNQRTETKAVRSEHRGKDLDV